MNDKYSGIVAALITPCIEPGVPDVEGISKLACTLVDRGCDGIFAVSSTGELPFLDEGQRREIVVAARKGVGDRAIVYAGISGTGLKQVVRYAENAAEDGADVAIVMVPFFLKLNQDELYRYISDIADKSPIPIGIYNHLRMPCVVETDTIIRLAKHPNIVVIKETNAESSYGVSLSQKLLNLQLSFFQGREPFLLDSFNAGAAGSVTALANIVPEWHKELYNAVRSGDEAMATVMQSRILSLSKIFSFPEIQESFCYFAFAIKCAAKARGFIEHTDGMVNGFKPCPGFEDKVLDVLNNNGLLVTKKNKIADSELMLA